MKLVLAIPFIAGPVFAAWNSPPTKPLHQHNANHVFNAIQSSMRQWGSSLNHNGMSIFLATVPKDVEFYHGNSNPHPVNGTQWLAFEPEHALVFARGHGPPGGGDRRPGGPPRPKSDQSSRSTYQTGRQSIERNPIPPNQYGNEENEDHREHDQPPSPPLPPHHFGHEQDDRRNEWEPEHTGDENTRQKPISAPKRPTSSGKPSGYLHTYRTKHPLRLLYVDGQSAAKSTKGTLDMQDLVLLHENPPEEAVEAIRRSRKLSEDEEYNFGKFSHDEPHATDFETCGEPHEQRLSIAPRAEDPRRPHGGGPLGEGVRAERLCELARTEYKGRIDGILRMEAGFEIILCDFAQHLDVVSIAAADPNTDGPGSDARSNDMLSYYQAVASRYDGIGGRRVMLEYSNFLTLFADEDALYFDETGRPRVKNETQLIAPFRREIRDLALSDRTTDQGMDWQAVSDMITNRYADRIAYLASDEIEDVQDFRAEAGRAIRPHIDYGNRNTSREIEHCSKYALPSTKPSESAKGVLAYDSIYTVNSVICRTLSEASVIDTLAHGLTMMHGLESWLGWTNWKKCSSCGPHEVCFLPIWPAGDAKDFEHPRCRSDFSGPPGNYWGGFGKPPGHDRGH
ncbi:hypothetical protein KC318_g4733 [Hortaea werneckii]|uniref:Uncharacterized protein n=1 Tax=Hortaea werneckii TaxID=91943 RepID=A0A3M7ATM1_HORWE|nr:hypothetical protein KC334_g5180 [Hortaea werneckii]KAI7007877.1 hypothetical protein KC355_g7169 [Hortaea werneckii]KAI7669323.1 hypothetical protein KC318_g4733 [Hortaea werneckii]RMY00992.1 hypothetical protein D0867_11544 [Hortaea werneckii]RMY30882.1 hypothetical protein D0866_07693 [Hortaea werneckii]